MNSKEKKLKIITLCATATLAALLILAGCTGQTGNTQENSIASTNIPETMTQDTEVETGEFYSIDNSEVIKIDLITMNPDVQNDNPLAYDYEVMPTDYLGKNDDGDYEFAGTVSDLAKTNYIGVMISEPDEVSEYGFKEHLYSGMKYEVFSGDENVKFWNFSFTIPAEEISESTKFIITGYKLQPI